jgi:hypothetical protein
MATLINWPAQVVAASLLKFETPVGAFLWMPEVEYPCLSGRVYMDLSCRFGDGRLIRTSRVVALLQEHGYTIAHTFSGSYYLLVYRDSNPLSGQHKLPLTLPSTNWQVH